MFFSNWLNQISRCELVNGKMYVGGVKKGNSFTKNQLKFI